MAPIQEHISRGSFDSGFQSVLVSIGTHSHKGGSRTGRKFLISPSGGIVRTGFTISRFWGREPDWFFRQPKQLQAELIADYNLNQSKKEHIDKRKKRYNLQKIKTAQSRYMRRGTDGEKT